MNNWYSERFAKNVVLTRHAADRMQQRKISPSEVMVLVEAGEVKRKDETHLWIFHAYSNRQDNLVCAAVVEENVLVIKTLMTHWQEEER